MRTRRAAETISKAKERARRAVHAARDGLVGVAHDVHEHPEIGFAEEYAATRLTGYLADAGFDVALGIAGMPTAFVATTGHGPLHVAFFAEYDALPPPCLFDRSKPPELVEVWLGSAGQGDSLLHACGHNLIAGAAVAAAIGIRDQANEGALTVSVFGTPGEELLGLPDPPSDRLAGGKPILLEAGALQGVNAILMVHPSPTPWSLFVPTHVYARSRARFAKTPSGGNPLQAQELRQLEEELSRTIRSLRQKPALFAARPEATEGGAQADLLWVAPSLEEAARARAAAHECFAAAAARAGVAAEVIDYPLDAELLNDPLLAVAYRRNSEILGREREPDARIQAEIREIISSPQLPLHVRLVGPILRAFPHLFSPPGLFLDSLPVEIVYGTDLAPVSHKIPSIHPMIGIGGTAANHSVEFAAQADSEEGYRAMLDAGVALAWTALDAATDHALREHLLAAATNGGARTG